MSYTVNREVIVVALMALAASTILVQMDLIVTFLERSGPMLFGEGIASERKYSTYTLSFARTTYPSPASSNIFAPLAEFSIVDGQKKARYLPALRSLALKTDSIDDWTLVPSIFGTPTAHSSTGLECHRHALEDVAICLETNLDSDLASMIGAGEETLESIVHLGEAGVKWKIQCHNDMIEVNGNG
ncbi:hypothetical protein BJ912DRAFT_923866 [Pholiota molesta]|nr:hypothetical protein BJ912DRAFT_923866 [Pholiota molesta]